MTDSGAPNPHMILSVGSKVVTKVETRPIGGGARCPAGIVGIVIAAPVDQEHAYRVRCVNGVEAHVRRSEIELLAHYQREGIERPPGPWPSMPLRTT